MEAKGSDMLEPKGRITRLPLPKIYDQSQSQPNRIAYPVITKYYAIKDGQIHYSIEIPRTYKACERMPSPTELSKMKEITVAEMKGWAKGEGNPEGLSYEDMEKKAAASFVTKSVLFACVYCKKSYTRLKSCRNHVFGVATKGARYCKSVCGERCEEEDLICTKIGKTSIPKRFPWAVFRRFDGTEWFEYDNYEEFEAKGIIIPDSMKKEWDRLMKEERNNPRGKGRHRLTL